ncbi:MAG: hypothetical protein II487_05810, partial [Schwartzia sp.]|nr:hypothetical protein [Schwartzia sp. (in: firmicutes)]
LGVVFMLGVLTNDLHFSFKAFPTGVMDANGKEVSGWLYYAVQVFIYGLYALALAIILKKNRRYVARKYRWMTIVPLLFGATYFLLCPLDIGHRFFNTRLWQMGDIMAFCIIGTLEACIQVGMIPGNRGYEELFSGAHFPAVILDTAGWLVYQTAADYPFQQSEDVKIVSHPISGGSAEYLVDIKQVRSLNQQLAERSQQIETRNAYLAEKARIKKERAELETKNRLYEIISNIVKPQLAHIDKLLNARSGCGNRELAKIAVLKAYIKRRSNMELLSTGGTLTVLELSSAVSESLDYIQLTGANAAVTTVGSGAYPASMIVYAYEHIEAIIEDCMDSLSDMIITIRADKADLTVRIMLRADSFSYRANDYPQSGKEFWPAGPNTICCSRECAGRRQAVLDKERRDQLRASVVAERGGHLYDAVSCKYCGKLFYPKQPNQVYCSDECRTNGSFMMRYGHDPAAKEGHPYNKRICIHCGKEFWPAGPNTKTCSEECSHAHGIQKMREWRDAQKELLEPEISGAAV